MLSLALALGAPAALAAPADCDDTYRIPSNPLDRPAFPGRPAVDTYTTADPGGEGFGGRIVVPVADQEPSGTFPTAWIVHGIGFAHTDYTVLQERLAQAGIASVALEYVEDPFEGQGGAFTIAALQDELTAQIAALHGPSGATVTPLAAHLKDRIALVGHSIGGGFVVGAAPAVAALGTVDLYSVVALAPNAEEGFDLTRDEAQGLLVVMGSDDADDAVNGTGTSGFLTYDISGSPYIETSYEGGTAQRFTKSTVYVDGAEHASYADPGTGPDAHRDVVHAYTAAYLLWSLRDEQDQHVFFKQAEVLDAATDVQLQWTEPTFRRVLDNFEGAAVFTNTLGGTNAYTDLDVDKGSAGSLFPESPHDTRVLRLAWNGGSPRATFGMPLPLGGPGGDFRDISRRRYLSLRVGQAAGATGATDFSVVLRDAGGEQSHPISAFGTVREPFGGAAQTDAAMETVLIPLCAYDQIDRTEVWSISLVFDRPGHGAGEIQLDLLEFID